MRRTVKGVNKGLADVPEITPENFVRDLVNYEFTEVNAVAKRVQMTDWGEGLATFIQGNSFNVLKTPDYAYYPPNLPTDINQDFRFLIPMFVFSIADGYQVILVYRKENGDWTYTDSSGENLLKGIYGDGVVYTEQSDPVFYYGRYLYISDGVNNSQYVTVEKDGAIRSGIMGLIAPDSIPIIGKRNSIATKTVDVKFNTVESKLKDVGAEQTGTGNQAGILVQYCYTVVDKFGNESNPSPIATGFAFCYQTLDPDETLGFGSYQFSEFISNMRVPSTMSSETIGNLTNFNLYRRVSQYREGYGFGSWKKVGEPKIKDKTQVFSTTNIVNEFVDTDPVTATDISYENDIAPVANEITEINGVPVLGGVKQTNNFIFPVKAYMELSISNSNQELYAGWTQVKIRFTRAELVAMMGDDFGTYFEVLTGKIDNEDQLMFLYTEGQTPIPCIYYYSETTGTLNYVDFYISLPQIAKTELIYFCWGVERPSEIISNEASTFTRISGGNGVNVVKDLSLGYMYGIPVDTFASVPDYEDNLTNIYNSVRNDRTLVTFENVLTGSSGGTINTYPISAPNKVSLYTLVETKRPTEIEWSALADYPQFCYPTQDSRDIKKNLPMLGLLLDSTVTPTTPTCVEASNSHLIKFGKVADFSNNIYRSNRFGKFGGAFVKITNGTSTTVTPGAVMTIPLTHSYDDGSSIHCIYVSIYADSTSNIYQVRLQARTDSAGIYNIVTRNLTSSGKDVQLYIGWSWKVNNYTIDDEDTSIDAVLFVAEGHALTETSGLSTGSWLAPSGGADVQFQDGDNFLIYYNKGTSSTYTDMVISGLEVGNEYVDTQAGWEAIWQRTPYFREQVIGWDGTENKSIDYDTDDIKIQELESYPNAIMWGTQGKLAIPSTNINLSIPEKILRISPTSSFLNLQHQNVLCVFTRNGMYLIPQEGLVFIVDNIIKESTDWGLLARDTFKITDKEWLWLTESGLMRWDSRGRILISDKIVSYPVKDNIKAYRVPIRNQYWINDYEGRIETEKEADYFVSSSSEIAFFTNDVGRRAVIVEDNLTTLRYINCDTGAVIRTETLPYDCLALKSTNEHVFAILDNGTNNTLYVIEDDYSTTHSFVGSDFGIGDLLNIGVYYDSGGGVFLITIISASNIKVLKTSDFSSLAAATPAVAIPLMQDAFFESATHCWLAGKSSTNDALIDVTVSFPTISTTNTYTRSGVGLNKVYYSNLDDKTWTCNDVDTDNGAGTEPSSGTLIDSKLNSVEVLDFYSDGSYLYIATPDSVTIYSFDSPLYTYLGKVDYAGEFKGIACGITDGNFGICTTEGIVFYSASADILARDTYVYNHEQEKFTKFNGTDMRIITGTSLTGGQRIDNINLFFNEDDEVKSYPESGASVVESAECTFRENNPFINDHITRMIVHGESGTNNTVEITTESPEYSGTKNIEMNTVPERRKNVPYGYFGNILTFSLKNYNKIRYLEYITAKLRER